VNNKTATLALLCLVSLLPLALQAQTPVAQAAALDLHRELFTLDTHSDTPLHMLDTTWDIGAVHDAGGRDRGKIDLARMEKGNLDALFFAIFVAQRPLTEKNYQDARATAERLFELTENMLKKYPDRIKLARTPDELVQNEKMGVLSACLGVENGFALGHDLSRLQEYQARGVRYVTLCHTKNNDICDSSTDSARIRWGGLSPFGHEVIAEMNRLGILVDISHVSDESFFQALKASKAPIFASHSCARALCNTPRNLSDDMLKALAANGGVMQMCILSEYVKDLPVNTLREAAQDSLDALYGPWEGLTDSAKRQAKRQAWNEVDGKYPRQLATVADVVDHIDHVVKLVGIDYIGIGTDFDGGGGVRDCNDVSQMPNITAELLRRGYSKEDIAKIWGGNFLRVFRRALEVAEPIQ
jgi:membrane dipeptidase